MKEFAEKLYSIPNFGIYLFAVIVILVILFFIVLFFGRKDTTDNTKNIKKNEEPTPTPEIKENEVIQEQPLTLETNNQEAINLTTPILNETKIDNSPNLPNENIANPFMQMNTEVPLNIKEPLVEEKVEKQPSEPFTFPSNNLSQSEVNIPPTTNVILNDPIPLTDNIEPSIPEEAPAPSDKTTEFDFDALADAISKELDSIKINKEEPVKPKEEPPFINFEQPKTTKIPDTLEPKVETPTQFNIPTFEPVVPDAMPEEFEMPPKKEEKKELPKRPTTPPVFSSVYVNRNNELNPTPKESNMPKKEAFELPKKVELPKKITTEPKVEPKVSFDINQILDELEQESYHINNN